MITLLSLRGFANRRGLAPGTVRRYHAEGRLPRHDGELTDGADIHHLGWLPETADNWQRPGQGTRTDLRTRPPTPTIAPVITLLSVRGFANRRGLAPGTVRRYHAEGRLPRHDGELTDGADIHHLGWLPETADNWQRPGQGTRTDLSPTNISSAAAVRPLISDESGQQKPHARSNQRQRGGTRRPPG